MIQHVTHVFTDLEALTVEIGTGAVSLAAENSQAQLVQIYCAEANKEHIRAVIAVIAAKFPAAVVVGATTIGEVAHGRLVTNQTVIGFTFFESSKVNLIAMASEDGDEQAIGTEVGRRVNQSFSDVAGILLLATTISINASLLLEGIESTLLDCPIFGGGAADYTATNTSLVFSKTEQFDKGLVAVIFSGTDLHIESSSYLGWQPLSHSMRVTQVDGLNVQQVDEQPAFAIYQRYLNLPKGDEFLFNALEFPFLLERDGNLLARVPVATNSDGSLQFVSQIKEGETFRIGYGDIDLIIENSKKQHEKMAQFCPQAIFLYTCSCRRFLMQESVELETLPFEAIAPTFGFYTFGEFFGSSRLSLMNATMGAVGLREGPPLKNQMSEGFSPLAESVNATLVKQDDPLANQHARVVARLMCFIKVVSSELEASIQGATRLSMTDQLTQLANRLQLDQVLDQQVKRAERYGALFSIILLDMDYFKYINDTHGHLMGDKVLVQVAQTIAENTRAADIVGRWGGEEFLIIAPNTSTNNAALLAEKLRSALENIELPFAGRITASFGVTGFLHGDDPETLIARADIALYAAKNTGRNQVVIDHVAQ